VFDSRRAAVSRGTREEVRVLALEVRGRRSRCSRCRYCRRCRPRGCRVRGLSSDDADSGRDSVQGSMPHIAVWCASDITGLEAGLMTKHECLGACSDAGKCQVLLDAYAPCPEECYCSPVGASCAPELSGLACTLEVSCCYPRLFCCLLKEVAL
jgi:hypothetical protein